MLGESGPIEIVAADIHATSTSVYNLEVESEHVYQIGQAGVLVHNTGDDCPLVQIQVDADKYPEAAKHLKDAGAVGKPLTVDRAGKAARRREALKGTRPQTGLDRDEAPPAIFAEGSQSVRPISSSDNRGAGASIGNQLRGVADGSQAIIDIVGGG